MSSFKDLIKQISDDPVATMDEQQAYANLDHDADLLPLPDDIANLILMHRNAHFGGKFSFMLEYYQEEGIGCCDEFDLKSVTKLAEIEEKMGMDLAQVRLSPTEHEQVQSVLSLYQGLRKLHSMSQDQQSIPSLLAELFLTEEAHPEQVIESLAQQEKALPYLIDILKSEEFLDPLFPGYGKTPLHIAEILGRMQSDKAIIPLFESMKVEHFHHEEAVIVALKKIGQPAFDFLISVLAKEPFTQDNEKAAICLTSFGETERFATAALKMLQNFQVFNQPNLVVHLILACLGLKEEADMKQFLEMQSQLPSAFGPDFQFVSSKLKKKLN